jgi:NAD dependent epimerase/dehydratase family enzyme
MLPPFKFGVGGRIGSGQQFMSWISLADLVAVYCFAVESETLAGPINAVAPVPITNARFTKILGQALRRPTLLPLPAAVVTALFGEMGQETLLADLAVQPQRLQQLGFTWEMPTLERALNALLQPARA